MDDSHSYGRLRSRRNQLGMAEEKLAFYGLIITGMMVAGYDVMVGTAPVKYT